MGFLHTRTNRKIRMESRIRSVTWGSNCMVCKEANYCENVPGQDGLCALEKRKLYTVIVCRWYVSYDRLSAIFSSTLSKITLPE